MLRPESIGTACSDQIRSRSRCAIRRLPFRSCLLWFSLLHLKSSPLVQGQRFRAGMEGTISVFKRAFKLSRCLYRSFRTYCTSVGSHVFAHNLVVLARL